jgi:hypothetical protein
MARTSSALSGAGGACTAAAGIAFTLRVCASWYGLISYAYRLMLIRWSALMLSEELLPPMVPGPSVIAGASPVV